MAFSDFTFKEIKKKFALTEQNENLFSNISAIQQSEWLKETLKRSLTLAYISEKSRSEAIVMPILLELKEICLQQIAIYSGALLEADKEQGLNGECDFILCHSAQTNTIEAPIFCMVEAKDSNIKLGLGQCTAQMLGAKIYNENENKPAKTIYGCVTTGEDWQFLKLDNNIIYVDKQRYYLNQLEQILGILKYVVLQ